VHGWFPIRLQLTQSLDLSPFSQYLACTFDDLEVCQLKVIQDQSRLHRPIESPLVGSYLTSFQSDIVSVFIFEIFDKKVLWPRYKTVDRSSKVEGYVANRRTVQCDLDQ